MAHLSLNRRGYVLKKKNMTERDIKKVERDLTFQPIVNPAFADLGRPKKFCTLLESRLRYYLPRYYGYANFGPPVTNTLSGTGEDIDYEVYWDLLPHQQNAWNTLKEHVIERKQGGILSLPCGFGKCLGKDTPILMFDGSFKMSQNIKPGDLLMGDDSTPRTVLSICTGREMLYRVTPIKGDPYIVNESHILSLIFSKSCTFKGRKYNKGDKIDLPLKDYIDSPESTCSLRGYRVSVKFPHQDVPVDPWIVGNWLGGGESSHQELLSYDNKHIPNDFKCNSREIQLGVLAGLIDADGHLGENGYNFSMKNEQMIDDIIYISRSLGFAAYKTTSNDYYRTMVYGEGLEEIPVKLKNKKVQKQVRNALITKINIEKLEVGDYYGFEIDGNRRFILGDFQVTHNTFISIMLGSVLKKKMLVIVNKEFLMRQWQEAIGKCSNASVGIIQRNKVDVEGKDIVIGMLHSVSMKDYPEHVFKDFGYVVVDECFPYEQYLSTDEGPMMIGQLYDLYQKDQTKLPLIESYNVKNGKIEYKSMTYGWKKLKNRMIELKFSGLKKKRKIKCTEDHLFLMSSGVWKKACQIEIGEKVQSNYRYKNLFAKPVDFGRLISSSIVMPKDDNDFCVYDIEVEENHNFIVCTKKDSHGFVAHNCHHISSETFSRALPKIACEYTLGLSATPIRKDGLTEVFLNYLGPILHKEKREKNNLVWIKYMEIKSMSEAFDTEIMQYTGTKDTGKMITNIAEFESINRLILEICRILVQDGERPRKILVLGARRGQLEWLHEAWEAAGHLNYQDKYATGGLYYGNQGMNKKQYWQMLEDSAKCDVIWGTMDIAKEGLDIPDRNTLLMLNGGHEVEQAVGRILRKFHKDAPPTVIDLVYKCGNFPKHASSRRDYYESEDYYIQKLSVDIEDDIETVDLVIPKLEKYLQHYPKNPEKDSSVLKKLKKNQKKDIPIGNHPPELEPIRVGGGETKKKLNLVKKKAEPLKSIPIMKDARKKKDNSQWDGQYDSDEERDLMENGLEQGHLCLLNGSDDETPIVQISTDGDIQIKTRQPLHETKIGAKKSHFTHHETKISPIGKRSPSKSTSKSIPVSTETPIVQRSRKKGLKPIPIG